MSRPRNYDDLRQTHEKVDAEATSPNPTQQQDQAATPVPQQNAKPVQIPPDVRALDEQGRAQYVQSLREKGRHEPWEIAHIERQLDSQSLTDQKAKEQLAQILESRTKEQPSEDYLPQEAKRDRAFAALKNVEMTDAQRQKMERLLGSSDTGRERTADQEGLANECDAPGGGRSRSR
jgi:hypothetical protein